MHDTGVKLLQLMFRPGETICLSPNEFGYHAVPLENAISDQITLVPTPESVQKRWGGKKKWEECFEKHPSDTMLLVALNPIKGFRTDLNCTAYRNFLVEMDVGPLKEQLDYIKSIGMPYSAVVFSGNKSLHFLISLDKDLPSEKIYRVFSEWILGVVTLADPNTKNPSRSIRIPGAFREPGKQQRIVEQKGPVKLEDLVAWLSKYPDSRPKEPEKRVRHEGFPSLANMKEWVSDRLINGLRTDQGRNLQWFSIACEFALAGYDEDDTLDILRDFFVPDRDFKEREWKTAIKSGFKYIYDREEV